MPHLIHFILFSFRYQSNLLIAGSSASNSSSNFVKLPIKCAPANNGFAATRFFIGCKLKLGKDASFCFCRNFWCVAKFCLISGCSPLPGHVEFGYFLNILRISYMKLCPLTFCWCILTPVTGVLLACVNGRTDGAYWVCTLSLWCVVIYDFARSLIRGDYSFLLEYFKFVWFLKVYLNTNLHM